jgi:hypothetical protein
MYNKEVDSEWIVDKIWIEEKVSVDEIIINKCNKIECYKDEDEGIIIE